MAKFNKTIAVLLTATGLAAGYSLDKIIDKKKASERYSIEDKFEEKRETTRRPISEELMKYKHSINHNRYCDTLQRETYLITGGGGMDEATYAAISDVLEKGSQDWLVNEHVLGLLKEMYNPERREAYAEWIRQSERLQGHCKLPSLTRERRTEEDLHEEEHQPEHTDYQRKEDNSFKHYGGFPEKKEPITIFGNSKGIMGISQGSRQIYFRERDRVDPNVIYDENGIVKKVYVRGKLVYESED